MKNIFVALALFAALGVSAQAKKTVAATQNAVIVEKLTPDAATERDMKALTALVTVEENSKPDINKALLTKYRIKEEQGLSAERKAALTTYVESQLATYLGDANFAKLKANTKLYNQLTK